jgi:hypothetical protein
MKGLKELWIRLKMPLNTFWARFRNLLALLSAFSFLATEVLAPWLQNQYLPEWFMNILQHVYMFGVFGVILTQLTVRDTNELQQKKAETDL